MPGIRFDAPTGRKLSDGGNPNALGTVLQGPGTPRTNDRLKLASERYREIPYADLDNSLGYHDRRLRLNYRVVLYDPLLADSGSNTVELFSVSTDRIFFLAPAPHVPTAAEADAETERLNGEHQAERAKFLNGQKKRELTLSDLVGRQMPTIRAAARLLLDLQGEISEHNGRLTFKLPETLATPGWNASYDEAAQREQVRDALQVLTCAREIVLRAGKHLNPDSLPDRQAGADGGVAA